ncbi:MAG: hypothetical protein ABSB79_15545 [Syntrophales bacterium]|jgi:hypothetical protein
MRIHAKNASVKENVIDMEVPDLNRIIETYVPVSTGDLTGYLDQLRQDILPHIRELQANGNLRWFSFMIHGASHITGTAPADGLLIHLRLEPATHLDAFKFIKLLPAHFQNPQLVAPLSVISGLEDSVLCNNDWAHAWRILGETSDWVLCLLEGYEEGPSFKHIIQFLHFFTNSLMLGNQCLYAPVRMPF